MVGYYILLVIKEDGKMKTLRITIRKGATGYMARVDFGRGAIVRLVGHATQAEVVGAVAKLLQKRNI